MWGKNICPNLVVCGYDIDNGQQKRTTRPTNYGGVYYGYLNNSFQCLNNIIRIFIHFFIHTYFHKITTLLEISYQIELIFDRKQTYGNPKLVFYVGNFWPCVGLLHTNIGQMVAVFVFTAFVKVKNLLVKVMCPFADGFCST